MEYYRLPHYSVSWRPAGPTRDSSAARNCAGLVEDQLALQLRLRSRVNGSRSPATLGPPTTRPENLCGVQRIVGQVGNLRPIVNRPARDESEGLVAAMLLCGAGWQPAAGRKPAWRAGLNASGRPINNRPQDAILPHKALRVHSILRDSIVVIVRTIVLSAALLRKRQVTNHDGLPHCQSNHLQGFRRTTSLRRA
jgi:hypothetical protein